MSIARYDPAPRSYAEFREAPTLGGFRGRTESPPAESVECPAPDDWGFDLFHETQKALAEMMEKEAGGRFGGGGGGQFGANAFGGSKLMAGFGGQPQQQHTQNNHR